MIPGLDKKRVDAIIRFALKEDVWTGDITSRAVLDRFLDVSAVIVAQESGIVCGVDVSERVFSTVDLSLKFKPLVKDGDHISQASEIAFIEGPAQSILEAERTALNFLSMMSGVTTKTHKLVEAARRGSTCVKVYDTRKTIPLHRYFQKYAVSVGGGYNHRKGLWDMVLIKDNHIRAFAMQIKSSDSKIIIPEILKRARGNMQKNIRLEIEVESIEECEYALSGMPDVIMLDNMTPERIKDAVALRKKMNLEGKVLFEVSGGITEDNIGKYAETGVEIISSGSITSSIEPINFSLDVIFRR